ncbi:MAG: PAS domain S-box protein [Dehalococcoidia bacterium]
MIETIAVFIVGNSTAFSLELLRRERQRSAELEQTQVELQNQLEVIKENERQLAALNQTATIISQSLQLGQVLDSAVSCVMDVMSVEVIRIYIIDEENAELVLFAHRGVSEDFVRNVGRIPMGEGFNGRVAENGEPLFVQDASEDSRLTKMVVRDENIRSQLIVPMMAKGKVVGTLSVAMHRYRQFFPEEIDLLTAIANQIGVAVDNARLYEHELEVVGQLRASEQRYRELFENAHDAIWIHDLDDRIVAANDAFVRLTGYTLDELDALGASKLISHDTRPTVDSMEHDILTGETVGSRGEVRLVKKDGSEAVIQLSISLVAANGNPAAIQSIAHDMTDEKRMQENLHFFIRQITRAQEEERKRIAQELHDDTVQALAILARQMDALVVKGDKLRRQEFVGRLEELRQETNYIMQGVQHLSQDLRPATLDRLGILAAVEWLASRTAEYSGIEVDVRFIGEERRLPDEVGLVLFRITQEALRNVWRHAEATLAEVVVEFGHNKTSISVQDNGKGFDAPDSMADLPRYGKLGLAGMEDRAQLLGGTVEIISSPNKGTTVRVELPV